MFSKNSDKTFKPDPYHTAVVVTFAIIVTNRRYVHGAIGTGTQRFHGDHPAKKLYKI